jgi:hypothetical protein
MLMKLTKQNKGCGLSVFFPRSPGQAPYGTKPAFAKRADYPEPPSVVSRSRIPRCPGGLYRGSIAGLGLELFPGSGVLPGPARVQYCELGEPSSATWTAAAECPEEGDPPARGGLQPRFPKEPSPQAADDSLTPKETSSAWKSRGSRGEGKGRGRKSVANQLRTVTCIHLLI